LAKAALVASAKAVLRTSAAQSTIFLVVNTCLFLSDQFAVFAAHWDAHTKWLNRFVEADRQNCGLFPSGLPKAK